MSEPVAVFTALAISTAVTAIIYYLIEAARDRWGQVPLLDPAWRWLHDRFTALLRKIHLTH